MTCLTPSCDAKVHSRGLCFRCYNRLIRQVRRGTTSWSQLIAEGKAKTSIKQGASQDKRRAAYFGRGQTTKDITKAAKGIEDVGLKFVQQYLQDGHMPDGTPLTEEEKLGYKKLLQEYGIY